MELNLKILSDVALFVAAFMATAMCLWSARKLSGRQRQAWTLIGLGCLSWAVGEGLWGYFELVAGWDTPFPSLADAGYLFGYVLVLTGLYRRMPRGRTRTSRIKQLLDAAIFTAVAGTVTWYFFAENLFKVPTTWLEQAIIMAYPGLDLILLFYSVALFLDVEAARPRHFAVWLAAGAMMFLVADSLYGYFSALESYQSGLGFDVVWVMGFACFGLAAVADTRPAALHSGSSRASQPDDASTWILLLPYVAAPIMVVVLVVSLVRGDFIEHALDLAMWNTIIFSLLLIRQIISMLENVSLYRQAELRSITDALTGAYNRHYLPQFFARWRTRAATGSTLSVMMVDVVDLKKYNDQFGHVSGDRRLVDVVTLLRSQIRPDDDVVRFGGDEFLVLLPDAGHEEALAIRDRIMDAVFEANQKLLPGEPPIALTIGVDCAAYSDLTELIFKADQAIWRSKEDRNRIQQELTALAERSERERKMHLLETVLSLAKIEELKDPYTYGHCERVRDLAVSVAVEIGMDPAQTLELSYAAVLHDVGKLAVPTEILNKPGPLNDREREIMKDHPTVGANIVAGMSLLSGVQPIIRYHHERYDGRRQDPYAGYPDGLSGDDIPLGARIMAVVDAFDAMTSDRPYRKGMTCEDAIRELRRCACGQFDPEVVEALIKVLSAGVQHGGSSESALALGIFPGSGRR